MAKDVSEWLGRLGLETYAEAFARNDVDLRSLPHLDQDDLKELGVSLGHRKVILAAIADRRDGTAAGPAPPTAGSATRSRKEAERRHLTVMFVDLVGSTALSGRLDPEDMREVIITYQNAVAGAVTRFEGHLAKYMGDGVLCYFGWPRAHEDDAERAVRAGLSIMRALAGITTPDGGALSARAGIASGLVVVGDLIGEGAAQEEAVVGDTPNLASRLQGLAAPGQLVLANSTRRLLGDVFELSDLGEHVLKGIDGKTAAFGVLGERSVESRFEARSSGEISAMVGREHELALMLERWKQAKGGEGQLVLLTGEAGIGKSRITVALTDALEEEEHLRLSFQCSPYHRDSALYPVIQQLTFGAGINAGDSNDEKLDKLEAVLVDGNAAPIGALLGLATEERYGPMNLAPQQQRAQTLQALAGQLIGLSRDEPVLFVLEDAHWIDATTLELVDLCLDQVTDARVLMLITARPTFEHGFGDHPAVSRLALNRLGRAQAIAIVSKLTGGRRLPEELLKVIVTQTDGVPLFVEELTKSVLESGQLEASEEGFKLNGPLSRLAIPATLHDSLMARLDRLRPVKEVAQMAACIGREFDYQLLKAISALDDLELRGALDHLISAELIFRRGLPADATYIFKHALVRDAAYESLLKARRQVIHERLVEVLEAGGGARPEILAHHATQAGLLEAAIGHWEAAGNAAMVQPAYQEAITHYGSAMDLMEHMEDQKAWAERELTIQLRLAQALIAKQGHGAAATAEAFARAAVLVEETGNADLRVPVYYGIWVGHYLRGEHEKNFRTASELTRQVDQRDEIVPRLIAHRLFGTTLIALGRLGEARRHLETSVGLYLPAEHEDLANQFGQDPAIAARTYLTFDMWLLGYVDQAAGHAAAIEEAADRLAHVNTVCWVAMHLATYALYARNDELLRTSVARLDAVSSQHGMRLWQNYCEFSKGLMQSRAGDPSGLERFEKAFDEYVSNGHWLFMPIFKVEQARELYRLGRNRDALLVLQEAKNIIEVTGECWAEAELCRVEGETEAALSCQGEAETAFRRALEISRAQGAKSWELRAATSLTRLWAKRGDHQAGLDLLQPVHAWFTEGHDTPDLKDAKALLDQLG